jgi:hypothetical protein
MNTVKLGDLAKDVVTGYTGAVTAMTTHLHNCRRFALQPRELADGKPQDALWFDEPQVEFIEADVIPVIDAPYSDITLGSKVTDNLSDFGGTVVTLCYYVNGCLRAAVQSRTLKDGLPVSEEYLPVEQLTLVDAVPEVEKVRTGGLMKSPVGVRMPNKR